MNVSNTNGKNIDSHKDEISIKELIIKIIKWRQYLVIRWKIILAAGLIGGSIGLAYAISKKTIYKAELTFALEDDKSSGGLGAAMGLASQFGIDLGSSGGGAFSGDNLLQLMKSRSMVEKALLTPLTIKGKSQTLAEFYIDFNNIRKSWEDNEELKRIHYLSTDRSKFTLKQDSVLGVLYDNIILKNLSVEKVDKKLSIITVKVETENELFSIYFNEILVKAVSDFYINTKTKKSVQNVSILQYQTDSVRRELNAALTGVAASIDNNPNANPSLQILKVPSQRRQVDVQANQAILTQLVANLEASKVALRRETPLIQIIDKPVLPLPKDKLGKMKAIVVGAILLTFLAVVIITCRAVIKSILS